MAKLSSGGSIRDPNDDDLRDTDLHSRTGDRSHPNMAAQPASFTEIPVSRFPKNNNNQVLTSLIRRGHRCSICCDVRMCLFCQLTVHGIATRGKQRK